MTSTMTKIVDDILDQADPRVVDYPMMSSIWPSFILTVAYFFIVKYAGPKFMENRKPYEIKEIMLAYNFGMVILSGYIMYEFAASGWLAGYSLGCQPVDYSPTPKAMRMVNVCWMFYISKFLEFFDTFFFILRKKYTHVSFLHVFHHGIMPISWWFGVKFVPGGFGTFHALLNSFIHFMMYMYYGLAALGPAYQKYLWWKKYMTKMQIAQFCLVCVHSSQLLWLENCDYPKLFIVWIGAYAIIFLVMFANFYRQAYKSNKAKQQAKELPEKNGNTIKAHTNGYHKED